MDPSFCLSLAGAAWSNTAQASGLPFLSANPDNPIEKYLQNPESGP
jgi:hypothetical protein